MSRDALTHAIREAFSYDACRCQYCVNDSADKVHQRRVGRRRLARELRNEAADAAGEGE
jgi:hypothetical protein